MLNNSINLEVTDEELKIRGYLDQFSSLSKDTSFSNLNKTKQIISEIIEEISLNEEDKKKIQASFTHCLKSLGTPVNLRVVAVLSAIVKKVFGTKVQELNSIDVFLWHASQFVPRVEKTEDPNRPAREARDLAEWLQGIIKNHMVNVNTVGTGALLCHYLLNLPEPLEPLVDLYLENNGNPDHPDFGLNCTPMGIIARSNWPLEKKKYYLAKLLSFHADPNFMIPRLVPPVVIEFVRAKDAIKLLYFAVEKEFDFDLKYINEEGMVICPLSEALRLNKPDCVRFLIYQGVDIDSITLSDVAEGEAKKELIAATEKRNAYLRDIFPFSKDEREKIAKVIDIADLKKFPSDVLNIIADYAFETKNLKVYQRKEMLCTCQALSN